MTALSPAKQRKCKGCGEQFTPVRPLQQACSLPCAAKVGKAKAERERSKAQREERRLDRKKLEQLKTKPQLTQEAQREFNRYVRLRDFHRPCISCGCSLVHFGVGGLVDAGHYRSVGSAPHLRFDEANCHAQCVKCNRYGSGMAVDYRMGLLSRLGLDVVHRLETDNTPRNYTKDELRSIRDTYRARANTLKKEVMP